MAKRKLNRSQAIRDELAKHPKAGPSGIVQLLAARGIEVSPVLVSNVKARLRGGPKCPGRRGRPPKAELAVGHLVAAANFARQVGSVEQAVTLLDTLQKLR